MNKELKGHLQPEVFMKHIPRFLLQPKGSNLIIDAEQPVIDHSPCKNLGHYYDMVFKYYEKYYRKSMKYKDKYEILFGIIDVVRYLFRIGLWIILAHLLFHFEEQLFPDWVVLLTYFIPVFISGIVVISIIALSERFDTFREKIRNRIVANYQKRSDERYEKRLDEMREHSEWDALSVIHYFESLYKWSLIWKENHPDDNLYSAYITKLKALEDGIQPE